MGAKGGRRSPRRRRVLQVLLLVAWLIGFAAIGATVKTVFQDLGWLTTTTPWWETALFLLIVVPVYGILQRLVTGRIRRGYQRKGISECALRPAVDKVGRRRRWRHGRLTVVGSDRLTFRQGGPVGMRFPLGRPEPFVLQKIEPGDGRPPTRREFWGIGGDPELRIVRITAGGQELELAVHPENLDRLQELANRGRAAAEHD